MTHASLDVLQVWPDGADAPVVPADLPRTVRLRAPGLEAGLLARSGAGVDVVRIRGAVRALAREHDVVVEVPLADWSTDARALVATIREAARLWLRAPRITFDIAPGESSDPWVVAALNAGVLAPERSPLEALVALRRVWLDRLAAVDPSRRLVVEGPLRTLDDLPRRTIFELLEEAWLGRAEDWPGGPPSKEEALATAERHLGEKERWIKALRQFTYATVRRMVVIPTWQCELRCAYCFIPKQDGRVMPPEVYRRSIEMLLSTDEPEVMLQFFGGEALLEWENVRDAIAYAHRRAAELGKRISFIVSSNGWSLGDRERLEWLHRHGVRLELSLDGSRRTQERYRSARWRDRSSYDHSIATHRDAILGSGIEQHVIMVVHPTNVEAMPDDFFHIADLGFRHIQINHMLGRVWTPEQIQGFARGLHAIGREILARRARGEVVELVNLRHRPMPMRLNGEVTIDWDGTIYGGNAFLHETEHKDKFIVGHLDDLTGVDRYWIDATDNNFLLDWSYRPSVTRNNLEVGRVMASFLAWLRKQLDAPAHDEVPPARPFDAPGAA